MTSTSTLASRTSASSNSLRFRSHRAGSFASFSRMAGGVCLDRIGIYRMSGVVFPGKRLGISGEFSPPRLILDRIELRRFNPSPCINNLGLRSPNPGRKLLEKGRTWTHVWHHKLGRRVIEGGRRYEYDQRLSTIQDSFLPLSLDLFARNLRRHLRLGKGSWTYWNPAGDKRICLGALRALPAQHSGRFCPQRFSLCEPPCLSPYQHFKDNQRSISLLNDIKANATSVDLLVNKAVWSAVRGRDGQARQLRHANPNYRSRHRP